MWVTLGLVHRPGLPARVFVQQLADSSVELVAWPFVRGEDYSSLQGEIVERTRDGI
jgi:hypothetical protein